MIELLPNKHKLEYVAASGTLGFDGKGYPWEQLLIFLRLIDPSLFTVFSKTITFEKTKGNLRTYNPLTWSYIRPMRGGSLNSVGLSNPGFQRYLEDVAPKANSLKIPLVPSITSRSINELIEMAQKLNRYDFVAIENSVSCPNIQEDCLTDLDEIIEGCKAIKEVCELPLILKLSVNHKVEELVPKLEGIVQAISINSVPWSTAFPKEKSPLAHLGGGGVSGQIVQVHTWELVKKLVKITSIPVIGPSVWEFEDIGKLRDMGAGAVSFGSIFLTHPLRATKFVRKDMKINKI
ncbi:MAG: hypothetical protein KAI71_02710 [Candidatus Pacebacteria bacterium]|nr:hypothetical protein [Candidatus Paceibacterota bacterium]